jgi:putative tricarboxylic transport membrane protein
MLLAIVIALCGLWLAFKGSDRTAANPPGASARIAIMVAYCIAYAFFFQLLGFIVATTAMTILVGRLFGGAWFKVAIGGLVMSGMFFVLFDRVLDVVLPLGILGGLL